ncbi:MAG: hypothetical protein KAR21_24250 [Spirochaetales bacterium]|nr:hypothetical protein [Spirochaetales bacterium]
MDFKSFKLNSIDGIQIPCVKLSPDVQSDKTALILPGYAYPVDGPLLFYTKFLLVKYGFHVITIDYHYNERETFLKLDENTKDKYFEKDQLFLADQLSEIIKTESLLLCGKSIGTTAMTIMYDHPLIQRRLSSISFIWYTPAQAWNKVINILKKGTNPSFLVVGDNDPYYDKEHHKSLESLSSYKELIIEGGGHLLEKEKDMTASIDNIKTAIKLLESLINGDFFSAKKG